LVLQIFLLAIPIQEPVFFLLMVLKLLLVLVLLLIVFFPQP